ncbi:hypothetical protein BXZ70DRAFT_711743 [Cristinia sonorae]|uniref:Uncharacterized protein n=1 Tax=Cristinia sonorae TaxID=1940300 RepID=A0A8K0UF45_9AGAR|nr:hypothetical protein BXZ70DRAFT_711743 [Cristinia sonorae]
MAQLFLRVVSLRRLTIQLFNSAYPLPNELDLTASTRLCELNLLLTIRKGSENFLESLRLPPSLSSIALALHFYSSDCGEVVPSLGWNTMDNYLTDGVPLLKSLHIYIHEAPLTAEIRACIYGYLAKALPRLREKGIVMVHYRTHDVSDPVALWH